MVKQLSRCFIPLFSGLKKTTIKKCSSKQSASGSDSSAISTLEMQRIIDKLLMNQHRTSTGKTYFNIWRQFNNFIIKLDVKPKFWEEKTSLFVAYLIDKGIQSSTIKSYVSAIKKTLILDKYPWNDKIIMLSSLTRACKLVNDRIQAHLPIHCSLLELILFKFKGSSLLETNITLKPCIKLYLHWDTMD